MTKIKTFKKPESNLEIIHLFDTKVSKSRLNKMPDTLFKIDLNNCSIDNLKLINFPKSLEILVLNNCEIPSGFFDQIPENLKSIILICIPLKFADMQRLSRFNIVTFVDCEAIQNDMQ